MEKETTRSFQDGMLAPYKEHKNCRVCGSSRMEKYLDLGMMPLPNNLEYASIPAKNQPRYPLEVLLCPECNLSQLSIVVDPKAMFHYYTYRSSINAGYVNHCKEMAYRLKNKYGLNEHSFVVDIAGNDGALLLQFKDAIDCQVLNVDPAANLCQIAEASGIKSIAEFWSQKMALSIRLNPFNPALPHDGANLITATNVFAHVDDVKDFLRGVKVLLDKNGVLILEFPYIIDFIEGFEVDTVYFEHLSYFSVLPLMRLCADNGMKIISVEKYKIHGGTVRIAITHAEAGHQIEQSVWDFVKQEMQGAYGSPDKYLAWAQQSMEKIVAFGTAIRNLKEDGKTVWAFAASAKGNTLLNGAGIDNSVIDFIIDETPEKLRKYSPGTGIMIAPMSYLDEEPPDYLVILSWNFAKEIMEKLRNRGYSGKFILPIPEFKIIDNEEAGMQG